MSLQYEGRPASCIRLHILKDLCTDIILCYDLLQEHTKLVVSFDIKRPPLQVCGLLAASVNPTSIFSILWRIANPLQTNLVISPPLTCNLYSLKLLDC